MSKLSDRVAYLEGRVHQMEQEMARMERDIADLLRRAHPIPYTPPYPPYRIIPDELPDPDPFRVNRTDWHPIVRGRKPTLVSVWMKLMPKLWNIYRTFIKRPNQGAPND